MLWIPSANVAKDYPPYLYAMGASVTKENPIFGIWSWPIG